MGMDSIVKSTCVVVIVQATDKIFTFSSTSASSASSASASGGGGGGENEGIEGSKQVRRVAALRELERGREKIRRLWVEDLCRWVAREDGKWVTVSLRRVCGGTGFGGSGTGTGEDGSGFGTDVPDIDVSSAGMNTSSGSSSSSGGPIGFFMELLESVMEKLMQQAKKAQERQGMAKAMEMRLESVVRQSLVPVVLNGLSRPASFPEMRRCYRLCVVVLRYVFNSAVEERDRELAGMALVEEFVKHLDAQILSRAESNRVALARIFALEVLRNLSEDHKLICRAAELSAAPIASGAAVEEETEQSEEEEGETSSESLSSNPLCVSALRMLTMIVETVSTYLLRIPPEETSGFRYSVGKFSRLQSASSVFVPTLLETITSSCDCLIGVTSTFNVVTLEHASNFPVMEAQKIAMESVSNVVLRCCSHLLEVCDEEDSIQKILQICYLFTSACGEMKVSPVIRDSFVSALLAFANADRVLDLSDLRQNAKALLALRTLFDIVNTCGHFLGSSWFVILKTFYEIHLGLDQMVHDASTRSRAFRPLPKKLQAIQLRLTNLFDSEITERFSIAEIGALVRSLCTLSGELMQGRMDTETHLFYAKKLYLILFHNVDRLHEIFPPLREFLVPHLRNLNSHSELVARQFSIVSLFELVSELLLLGPNPELEGLFMGLISEVTAYSKHVESRMLECIPKMVERTAPNLSVSWKVILRILRTKQSKLVTSAFFSVLFVGNNALAYLEDEHLLEFITTIEYFAMQNFANISLRSISLYLTAYDHMVVAPFDSISSKEAVLFRLFESLKDVTLDSKNGEKRDSALRYFFDMTAPLAFQSDDKQRAFLDSILIPLLTELLRLRKESLLAPSHGEVLKRDVEFQDRRHDSAMKQWDSTVTLALEGCLSKFIVKNARLINSEGYFQDTSLTSIFQFVAAAIHDTTEDSPMIGDMVNVALNGAASDILPIGVLNDSVRTRIWNLLADSVWGEAISCPAWEDHHARKFLKNLETKVIPESDSFALIFPSSERLQSFLDSCLVGILPRHAKTACFRFLVALASVSSYPDARIRIVTFFLQYLLPHSDIVYKRLNGQMDAAKDSVRKLRRKQGFVPEDLTDKEFRGALDAWTEVFLSSSRDVKDQIFVAMIKRLGTLMLLRYVPDAYPQAVESSCLVHAFDVIVRDELETQSSGLDESEGGEGNEQADGVSFSKLVSLIPGSDGILSSPTAMVVSGPAATRWNLICIAVEDFLFSYYASDQQTVGDEDVLLVMLLRDILRSRYETLSTENREYVLRLIVKAVRTQSRIHLANKSLQAMFELVVKDQSVEDSPAVREGAGKVSDVLGKLVAPIVFELCSEVLSKYLEDVKKVSVYGPLGQTRRDQVLNMFFLLEKMEMRDGLFGDVVSEDSTVASFVNSSRGLLIRLLPVISEFATVEDRELRDGLARLLRLVCRCFGLQ